MVPGKDDIARATQKLMAKYRVVIWAHHGLFCAGATFDQAFGMMETVVKSADIALKVMSTGRKVRQTITSSDIRKIAKDFKLKVNEAHQFCTVGRHAMVGGMSKIRQDVPPFMLCDMEGSSQKVIGPNVVGLTRRGFSRDTIAALKEAFRFIYHSGLNRSQALERVENDIEQTPEVKELVEFYRNSKRGVC